MKILEVQIENFGKFHDFCYKFNGSGIEILKGENEFGKTTLIAFIQRVLYGFLDKRRAENMYDTDRQPYGGRLLVIANDGRTVTIERIGRSKGGTLRVYDTASGEELNAGDYISQGAEFYRNIYMIHLKDLISEASLSSGEIRHHLYGIERAFGNVSPLKIREILSRNCDSLYRPRGKTQIIPELAKSLFETEEKLAALDREICALEQDSSDIAALTDEQQKLQQQIALLERASVLTSKSEELKLASVPVAGLSEKDKFFLKNKDRVNELASDLRPVEKNSLELKVLEEKISHLADAVSNLEFRSEEEYSNALTQYQTQKNEHEKKLMRHNIEQEEYEKSVKIWLFWKKYFMLPSLFLLLPIIAAAFFNVYYLMLLILPGVVSYGVFVLKKPGKKPLTVVDEFEEKEEYFAKQKQLLQQFHELSECRKKAVVNQEILKKYYDGLSFFSLYIDKSEYRSMREAVTLLSREVDTAIRNEICCTLNSSKAAAAAAELALVTDELVKLRDICSADVSELPALRQKLEDVIKKSGGLLGREELKKSKIEQWRTLNVAYLAEKARFNKYCRSYLKWKTALNIWEKTVSAFEKFRQGDVMQSASKYFAELTDNAYIAIRKVVESDSLVVFDGKNDKTVDNLSSGTREQLLLVLRLALIEYIERSSAVNISMPLLMDDIFVNYDNKREKAAWQILERFARDRQIIFCRAKD